MIWEMEWEMMMTVNAETAIKKHADDRGSGCDANGGDYHQQKQLRPQRYAADVQRARFAHAFAGKGRLLPADEAQISFPTGGEQEDDCECDGSTYRGRGKRGDKIGGKGGG